MALSTGQVHIERALSDFSVYYRNPSYVADVLAPAVVVVHESDKYYIYGKENFKIPPAHRRDKSRTKEITYSLSTDSYYCEEYGYHERISDRERKNSDDVLRPDIDVNEHLTETCLLDKEYRTANKVLDSTDAEWGDYSSSHFNSLAAAWDDKTWDVRADFYTAKYQIFKDSRKNANHAIIPTEVAYQLAQMDQIDELRKYTDPNLLTDSGIPPKLWGLKIDEAQSTYDTSLEGDYTGSYSETWGQNVVVSHINPSPISLKTLTFMLTMQARPFETRKWREEETRCDVIEVTHIYDIKMVAPACGFVMLNAITAS